jgi:hypothetical protein
VVLRRARHSYRFVLLLICASFVFTAAGAGGAVAVLGLGDFRPGDGRNASLRLYFSYVTLASVGYGDYTPTDDLGQTLAIVEALLGQLYLVTVVAVIAGRLNRDRPA